MTLVMTPDHPQYITSNDWLLKTLQILILDSKFSIDGRSILENFELTFSKKLHC